jgi:ribosomal protein S18 acetylase RimI-like enzyme
MLDALHYQSPADLYRAQAALMAWMQECGPCNYLHKGDIGHRLFNGCYAYEPADMMRYWQDEAGEICAFAILYPHWEAFDLQVAPGFWRSERHARLIDFCESETLVLAKKFGLRIKELALDVSDCDKAFIAFVEERGFHYAKHSFSLTRHGLGSLPDAELPPAFHIRQATADDADRLADVHNHSFTSKWDAESYAKVFRSPHLEYEFVVEAPDGRFAAFTNVWIDDLNSALLFEPVGTHADFRRRGIGKALMVWVLKRMQAERGIKCAYVCHAPASQNPAAAALYASVGFEQLHDIYEYAKPVA